MATRKKTAKPSETPTAEPTPPPSQSPVAFEESEDASVSAALAMTPEFIKFSIAKRLAHTLAHSNLVPEAYRGRPADCFIAMQLGAELGINPVTACASIVVIDSKPTIYGDALIGIVRRSGLCEYIKETYDPDTKTATCETKRKHEQDVQTRSFSWEQATMAGLVNKGPWRAYPQRMLQMRARSWCLRDTYADALKGLGVKEEVEDFSNEPAPITQFEIPKPQAAEATAMVTTAIALPARDTYERVIEAFEKATNMAELLTASNLTKGLTNEVEISAARVKYGERRQQLQAGA